MTPEFIVSISFLIMVALIVKPVKKALLAVLDQKIVACEKDLADSHNIREDAYAAFEEAQQEAQALQDRCDNILRVTQEHVEKLKAEAELKINLLHEKRQKMVQQTLTYHQSLIILQLKQYILAQTMQEVEHDIVNKIINPVPCDTLFAVTKAIIASEIKA